MENHAYIYIYIYKYIHIHNTSLYLTVYKIEQHIHQECKPLICERMFRSIPNETKQNQQVDIAVSFQK